jgi:hypothetical protein
MSKIDKKGITGTFIFQSSTLQNKFFKFLILNRKQTTPTKTDKYLLQVLPNKQYISSLYFLKKNNYKLDYLGHSYNLTLNKQNAIGKIKSLVY